MKQASRLKYCALGDSITYGFIPRNYPGHPGQLESYAALTAKGLGMEFLNYGVSDSTIANLPENTPMCIRYREMPDDADLVTVTGGTNDVRLGIRLGNMEDRGTDTFYGAWHTLLGGLKEKYSAGRTVKNTTIVVLTPIKLLDASKSHLPDTQENNASALFQWDKWIEAIKEVAEYHNLPVVDLHNESGITPHLSRTIKGTHPEYSGYYNPFISDGTHPTQEGAQMMADILMDRLKSLLRDIPGECP